MDGKLVRKVGFLGLGVGWIDFYLLKFFSLDKCLWFFDYCEEIFVIVIFLIWTRKYIYIN